MKKTCKGFCVLVFIVSVFSCGQSVYKAPYVLTGPESIAESTEGFCEFAGVFAQIYNSSDKDIASIELSFNVFDSTTKKNPFAGSNHITSLYDDIIYSGETAELCISLDFYIHTIPTEPFIISNFCINAIEYTDGSTWTDYLCIHTAENK